MGAAEQEYTDPNRIPPPQGGPGPTPGAAPPTPGAAGPPASPFS
jgi:hypothetical protein